MDELSGDSREALRRYHAAAGLSPPARRRVWRDIEASLADEERAAARASDRRRNVVAVSLVTALAAAVLFAVCDVRERLGARRVDADAAVYEASPGREQPAEGRVPAVREEPAAVETTTVASDAARPSRSSRASRREATPGSPEAGLAAEVALMRRARTALDAGDAEGTLRTLAEHERDFPRGQMEEDRLRLRIEALCALGQLERGRAEAEVFLREHPGSTHTARVRGLCREAKSP